jgi:hypothetical protein
MRTSLSPLPGSEQLSPDQLAQFVRPGYPQVRHSPFPPVAQSAAGAQVHSIAQTLAAKSVSAIPALNNKNQIDVSKSNGAAFVNKTQDYVDDGATYARVVQTALTNNQINPAKPGVLTVGSIPATGSGSMAYTATTSTITWTWTSLLIYKADGTQTSVPNGSQLVTGLTAGTTYYFYPLWDDLGSFLTFTTGNAGSPVIANTAPNLIQTQFQNLQYRIPLSAAAMPASTTSSGTGGGSGGGSGGCLHEDMLVEERRRGTIRIADVQIGNELLSDKGWEVVVGRRILPCETFVQIHVSAGQSILVSATHPFTTLEGEPRMAKDLSLSDILTVREGFGTIRSIEVVQQTAFKVSLTVKPNHVFFAGATRPAILVHNLIMPS